MRTLKEYLAERRSKYTDIHMASEPLSANQYEDALIKGLQELGVSDNDIMAALHNNMNLENWLKSLSQKKDRPVQHTVSLEIAQVDFADRFEEGENVSYQPVATTQSQSREAAKALMLDNVLEALNGEDLTVQNQWLRLQYYENGKLVETECF